MLKRKIEDVLLSWKQEENHKPIVIKGCRQCGKTFSVMKFAQENYQHVVYLNFMLNPDYALAFDGSKVVDDMVINISAMIPGSVFIPQQTCLILDEIQECAAARTALKFFKMDGRYDVIATGSLLGVRGYGTRTSKNTGEKYKNSIPVGYEKIVDMYPLDFEEFLWANGITAPIIDKVKKCFEDEMPVPDALHLRFRQLILQYTVVGGMPAAVNLFLQYHDLGRVLEEQRNIIAGYEEDMVTYADEADKYRIRECFDSIPLQLSKENKKFQYTVVRKNSKASQYQGSLQWIEDAGIITRCHNLNITELPLDGNAVQDAFKVYMVDTGLFVSMLEDGTQFDILQGNLYGYKGAIFENLMADIFTKMKRKLYYFRKDTGLEVDFVIRYKGECVLVEVKAKDGNTKSTKTILANPEKYHVYHAIKLGDYNVGRSKQLLTIPLYMAFLLRQS